MSESYYRLRQREESDMKNWLKRLWIKINTCRDCGLYMKHTVECIDRRWDGYAFENEYR